MSDFLAVLGILLAVLAIGAVVDLWLIVVAWRDLRRIDREGLNGPRQVIVHGTLRRIVLRLLMQVGLIVLYGWRLLIGTTASPALALLVGCLLVAVLTIDAVLEANDRRLLHWFLRHDYEQRRQSAVK